MRWSLIALLALIGILVVSCSPSDAGKQLLGKSGFDASVTGRVVDSAFDAPQSCSEDQDCPVGRACVNESCQPKPPR